MIRTIVIIRHKDSGEVDFRFSVQTRAEVLEEALRDGEEIPSDHILELQLGGGTEMDVLSDGSLMLSSFCAVPHVMVALAELFRRIYRAGQQSVASLRIGAPVGGKSFPQYQMIVGGETRWMSLSEAAAAFDSGWVPAEIGDLVIDAAGSHPRQTNDDDRRRICNAADEYSESK